MNLITWQTIFISLLQGVTELFPVSSLGQTVIFPGLFGWGNLIGGTQCDGQSCFVPLVTALHLGTSAALLLYFWRDWWQVLQTLGKSIKEGEVRRNTDSWVSWLIIAGSIPAGLLGAFLETPLKRLFASPLLAAAFLVCNGSVLFLGEGLRRRAEQRAQSQATFFNGREPAFRPLKSLTIKEALIVGCAQAFALIPGFSRSGMTMVAGLGLRLTHEDAAHYSFLLGTPIILAAGLLEVPQLFHQTMFSPVLIIGNMILCGVAAFLSTKFLMKYFEKGNLIPFAYYCWGFGLLAVILFLTVIHV
ncbi:MAG TPA: undecaprenyl-diphosphate phosphatase [Ktedonobacteraceae bacterium]|nr:undecaprenyl-diphosphate phosphatase [Ktedonobacteraceae bacterium]